MKLQNELDMVDNIFALEAKVKELESQVNSLFKYRVKYSNVKKEVTSLHKKINKMKCCGNCKHVDVYLCSLLGEQITPAFCCAKWELRD